jgi:polypeptide N-acetylgalactosaminyltransferase
MPYGFGSLTEGKKGPIITINYKRVVEVWMDPEYKEFFYTREPMARYTELGDISQQLRLKESLQCKSFDWFMTNVAYDMLQEFPKLPKVLYFCCLDAYKNIFSSSTHYVGTRRKETS